MSLSKSILVQNNPLIKISWKLCIISKSIVVFINKIERQRRYNIFEFSSNCRNLTSWRLHRFLLWSPLGLHRGSRQSALTLPRNPSLPVRPWGSNSSTRTAKRTSKRWKNRGNDQVSELCHKKSSQWIFKPSWMQTKKKVWISCEPCHC